MTPTQATDLERREYLSDMPERWRGVSQKLWKEPNLEMVALALRDLDLASALGNNGFTGAFYKAFSSLVLPQQLAGFFKERRMDNHLFSVQKIWKSGC